MSAVIQKITKSDQKVALLSAKILAASEDQATKNKDEVIKLRIQGSDEVVIIPLKALQLLNSIIQQYGSRQINCADAYRCRSEHTTGC